MAIFQQADLTIIKMLYLWLMGGVNIDTKFVCMYIYTNKYKTEVFTFVIHNQNTSQLSYSCYICTLVKAKQGGTRLMTIGTEKFTELRNKAQNHEKDLG